MTRACTARPPCGELNRLGDDAQADGQLEAHHVRAAINRSLAVHGEAVGDDDSIIADQHAPES